HKASVLRVRLHPHRAFKGPGVGASRVRSIRLLDHRIRHSARANGRRPVSIEGAASGTLRLPFAGVDGCNRYPRRQGVGGACSLSPMAAASALTREELIAARIWAGPLAGRQWNVFATTGYHLRQSVSCFSSIEKTAPSFTSTFRTMATRAKCTRHILASRKMMHWLHCASEAGLTRAGDARYSAPCRNAWRRQAQL